MLIYASVLPSSKNSSSGKKEAENFFLLNGNGLKLISDKSFPTFHIQIEYQIASRGVVRIMHHPPPYTDFAPLGRWDKLMSASDYYNLERERAQGNLRWNLKLPIIVTTL